MYLKDASHLSEILHGKQVNVQKESLKSNLVRSSSKLLQAHEKCNENVKQTSVGAQMDGIKLAMAGT